MEKKCLIKHYTGSQTRLGIGQALRPPPTHSHNSPLLLITLTPFSRPYREGGSDKTGDKKKREMIKAGALTETRQEKKKKPLGQKQENMIPHGEPRRQNRKRQTIRTPRATRLTLHHINPSTEREPWETSPAVTSPALIQPVTTSSRSTAAARADTLSHSVGRKKKKASDVQSCDQRESES